MKFGLEENIIEKIIRVLEEQPKVDKAYVFGSRAKGNYRPDSDIDIAVKGYDLTVEDMLKMSAAIDKSDIGYDVDLVDYDSIKEEALRDHVARVGNEFYSSWTDYTLGKVCSKIGSGATPRGGGNVYKLEGISLIRSQNVLDLSFSYDGLALIDGDQANELRNVNVKENDILLNITGDSVARVCKVPKEVLPARVNQHVAIVRPNSQRVICEYLLYYLFSIKDQLMSLSEIGGTRNALTKGMLEDLNIRLPNIHYQALVSDALKNLDNKIDLLHRQNKTLESMAEALFRQWFIEKSESAHCEAIQLNDILHLEYGKALKEDMRIDGKYPVVGSNGIVDFHSNFLVEAPGLVIGRKGTLGKVTYLYENFYPIDTTYYVTSKIGSTNLIYEYFLLRSLNLEGMNSDSAVPGLNREIALSTEIVKAPLQKIKEFSTWASEFFKKIGANKVQIHTITKLRDDLMPKLLAGDARVKMPQ